jgi:hypothetical protein
MRTIKAVYKRLGDMLVYYSDGTKKKLDELTESELRKADAFCTTHHIHTEGNIIEYAGTLQPLHCIIWTKKPFSYVAITTFGTLFTITEKSPQELIDRCDAYIKTCETVREQTSSNTKYSCGEGGI